MNDGLSKLLGACLLAGAVAIFVLGSRSKPVQPVAPRVQPVQPVPQPQPAPAPKPAPH